MSFPADERPVVLLRGDAATLARAWQIVDAALRTCPHFGLVIEVPAEELDVVRARYSHEIVVPFGTASSANVALELIADDPGTVEDICARLVPSGQWPERQFRSYPPEELDVPGGARIPSLDALKARLGGPAMILCLGNGPSSEDPGPAAHTGEILFRVNWNWLHRGLLDRPHVVFTADPDLPPAQSRAVLAFPTAASGLPILKRHAAEGRPPASGYLFLDQLSPPPADLGAAIIPTNGALMIAIATALQPRRLIIAGMDLYSHPSGRYPGQDAVDGYAREHSAACDLDLIRASLRAFRGETTILSANLLAALDEASEGQDLHRPPPS